MNKVLPFFYTSPNQTGVPGSKKCCTCSMKDIPVEPNSKQGLPICSRQLVEVFTLGDGRPYGTDSVSRCKFNKVD